MNNVHTRPGYGTTETQAQTCSRDRCKDSFQTKTLRKPFLLSLVAIIPWFLIITREEIDVLASAALEDLAHSWTLGAQGIVLPIIIKTEHLRECSASRVWPYMHQLRIMSLVNVGFARLLCFTALRSVSSANAAPGELLRLCPSSAGRAPQ